MDFRPLSDGPLKDLFRSDWPQVHRRTQPTGSDLVELLQELEGIFKGTPVGDRIRDAIHHLES